MSRTRNALQTVQGIVIYYWYAALIYYIRNTYLLPKNTVDKKYVATCAGPWYAAVIYYRMGIE